MDSPIRFTRPLVAFLIGVPLAWAVLLWFHPDVDPNHVYSDLREDVVAYQVVHAGTLVFIGLIGLALYLLVRDLPGTAARISRLAIGPFVVLYAAYESVIGLAIGALVQHGNDAPVRQRPAIADSIQSLGDNVIVGDPGIVAMAGSLAWIGCRGGRDRMAPGWRAAARHPPARAVLHGGVASAADRADRARVLCPRGGTPGPRPTRLVGTRSTSTSPHGDLDITPALCCGLPLPRRSQNLLHETARELDGAPHTVMTILPWECPSPWWWRAIETSLSW
jgi:hypothetical protein